MWWHLCPTRLGKVCPARRLRWGRGARGGRGGRGALPCPAPPRPVCLTGRPASLAVVYHHGSSATGGHYTTDVFQIGLNGWLRIDDQTVKVVNQYQVVKPTAERTAYLLYYRRVDLL